MHKRRTRLAPSFWLLFILGLTLNAPASGEDLRYFRDWLASCGSQTSTACRLSGFQLRDGGPEYDHALRIERSSASAPIGLIIESRSEPLARKAPVEIRVDNGPATTLLEEGYRLDSDGRVLTVTAQEAISSLFPRLRAGNRVYVDYRTAGNQSAQMSFSLLGLSAALDFMQSHQGLGPARDSGPLPRDYRCLGNEPFWNLAISGSKARLSQLGEEAEGRELIGRSRSMEYLAVPTFAWRGRGPDDDADLVVFITRERCLDTMADRPPYAYAARISLPGGDTRFGCCNARAPVQATATGAGDPQIPIARLDEKPVQDWSHRLLALMPAIRLCLERAPQPARTVSTAWSSEDGLVGVRLVGGPDQRFECLVESAQGKVVRFQPLPPGSPALPGEGMPLYRPASIEPPGAECHDRERVVAADGSLLGHLAYEICFRAPQDSPEQTPAIDSD